MFFLEFQLRGPFSGCADVCLCSSAEGGDGLLNADRAGFGPIVWSENGSLLTEDRLLRWHGRSEAAWLALLSFGCITKGTGRYEGRY
jgi:hypothetical protein